MFLYQLDRCKILRTFPTAKKKKKSHADMKSTTRFISYFITKFYFIVYTVPSIFSQSFDFFQLFLSCSHIKKGSLQGLGFTGIFWLLQFVKS